MEKPKQPGEQEYTDWAQDNEKGQEEYNVDEYAKNVLRIEIDTVRMIYGLDTDHIKQLLEEIIKEM